MGSKEIIENAEALSNVYYSDDEAGDEARYEEETSSSQEARRRRKETLSRIEDLSDSETIIGKDSSAAIAHENTAPTGPRGLPILDSHEVMHECANAGRSLEEATNKLEAMVMTEEQWFGDVRANGMMVSEGIDSPKRPPAVTSRLNERNGQNWAEDMEELALIISKTCKTSSKNGE
ncbi:MAG: hypothetical protein Q9188_003013 [Gyalolechia gomerana]